MQIRLFKWSWSCPQNGNQKHNCTILEEKSCTHLMIVRFPWKHFGCRRWWQRLVQGHVMFRQHSWTYVFATVKCSLLFSPPWVVHIYYRKCQLAGELPFQRYVNIWFFFALVGLFCTSFYVSFPLCLCFWSQFIWGYLPWLICFGLFLVFLLVIMECV